ncbi:MAG: aspartate--tRNA ligase [Patescibacteria group bacterium]|nr:aspartate--tRNA ligase [Patescibacteria group bacterium]
MLRTHTCGQLNKENAGQMVELAGWVASYRNLGGLLFIDLRDRYGITQLTFNPAEVELFEQASHARLEWVIRIKGKVNARPENMVNKDMVTGEIEVAVFEIEILSKADNLPFPINNEKILAETSETLRLKYRFLDLRRPKLQAMLMKKAAIIQFMREYFIKNDFVEIQTPILANSSPEGARDFLVPSRLYPGKFYALPQAPQQFKQLLMVAGMDKYFQVAPCFRDEDTRVDRHYGEFYQLDMEMSFAGQDDVFAIMEPFAKEVTEKFSDKELITTDGEYFKRIPWREAMEVYGSDKPDLRYDLKIKVVSDLFKNTEFSVFKEILENKGVIHALKIEGGATFSRKQLDDFGALAKKKGLGGLAHFALDANGEVKSSFAKFLSEQEIEAIKNEFELKNSDLVFFASGAWLKVCQALGAIRITIANEKKLNDNKKAAWCWIVDYPMFEDSELEPGRIDFGHNPFSMPQGGLEALNTKDPLDILAYQYDLVLNGFEISSGAVRNHEPEIMYRAFEVAGYTKDDVDNKFGAMINAFKFGAPPHAGNAPGIDRLIMVLNDWDSIRDIYAFPKDGQGRDVMTDSPSAVDPKQLNELKIKLND